MFRKKDKSSLELAIDRAFTQMYIHDVGSEEYLKRLDVVTKLHKLKEDEKTSNVSKDTLVLAGANLLGIFMIIKHENVNVITSKAIGLLFRPR